MTIKNIISYCISYLIGRLFYFACRVAGRCGYWLKPPSSLPDPSSTAGISIIVSANDDLQLLVNCLNSLQMALTDIATPQQIIVLLGEASAIHTQDLHLRYPKIEWLLVAEPVESLTALNRGLELTQYEWVFLLNGNIELAPDCLRELKLLCFPWVFSVMPRVIYADHSLDDGAVHLKDIRIDYDDIQLAERAIGSSHAVEHWCSHREISLYRQSLLKEFVRATKGTEPGLEVVDWGIRAGLKGYTNVFAPLALAHYPSKESTNQTGVYVQTQHTFEQKKWSFYLKYGLQRIHPFCLGRNLRDAGYVRWNIIKSIITSSFLAAADSADLRTSSTVETYYSPLAGKKQQLPWLVLVVPFAIFPAGHGAAIRQRNIYKTLSNYFNLWLVSDEGSVYRPEDWQNTHIFSAVSLLKTARHDIGSGRTGRMTSHSRQDLRDLLTDIVRKIKPAIVQIEHEELCELVSIRTADVRWAITLHDVNLGLDDATAADKRLMTALQSYDFIFTCSPEDAQLLPMNNVCIENGMDPEKFHYTQSSSGQTLVFVGPFRYAPNQQGINAFINHVWQKLRDKYPEMKLLVLAGMKDSAAFVQSNPFYQQPGVELINTTSRVEDYLAQATMVINPLKGVRGSCLKNIEALAAGRLCISMRDAARGLEDYQLSGLKIVDDWDTFFQTIDFYMENQLSRHREEQMDEIKLTEFYWSSLAEKQGLAYGVAPL